MKRWIVTFKSHASGPTDEHFVGTRAPHMMAAIKRALAERPPLHPWTIVRALPWPPGCDSLDAAAKHMRMTGTR